ncbi:spore germination protein [Alicyclobacillus sp. ALC3]|uniref:spore germination protein n=1 Tax=Alicyclobacillus sp. ALC3 TaxID=2796143 RepID=UPI002378FF52|nr:spore germination protein [Alicyclobacillus sp. ALC3]WDL99574.1 spore germination protein [Alicyclobacillus sp. ALC3]
MGDDQPKSQPVVPDFKKAPHYKGNLKDALRYFAESLGASDDYVVRVVKVAGISAAIVFIQTISDHKAIEETLRELHQHQFPKRRPKNFSQYLIEHVLPSSDAVFMENLYELKEAITGGDLVLLIDTISPALVMGAKYVEHRSPEQPFIESSVRGSQVSFVENIDVNIGLIRNSLNTETLRVKKFKVGYRSRRDIALIYLEDVANPVLIETVTERISAVHIDVVSQSSAIEHRIVDHPWTPLPLTRLTQRIDSVAREINQGKATVIVDGDPTVLIVPASLQDMFQTEEDYGHSWLEAVFLRWLRALALLFSVFLPALYIAFVDFNPELLPKVLGLQIARSREGVPFPAVMEVLIMQSVVEILREATLRMPKQMGQTIGIVGGLVVGEASVQAGLVSNILIIVVSLSAVSIFVTPSYEFATVTRLASWVMIVSASILGLYGLILMTILLLSELSATKSFGLPYLAPFDGAHIKDVFTDGIIRLPVNMMSRRTSHLHPRDSTGQAEYHNPIPHPQLEKAQESQKQPEGRKK